MVLLRKLLWPFSLLYAAAVWLRNKCYDLGWCSSERFDLPVLCIGNLSVGGSGKTPMVEWVLPRLRGRNPAVLSRGYRRRTRGFVLASPGSTAIEIGDEPAQLARKFPGVPVAVDADRRRGIRQLIARTDPGIIVLDDGFQHRRVRPSGSILLTAWDALYPDQGYLPSGDLRDHKSQARRADVIAVTKCPVLPDAEVREAIRDKLRPAPNQLLVFATLEYAPPRDQDGNSVPPEALRATPCTLVTGIARPEPLVRYLQEQGVECDHLRYPDHHAFTARELEMLRGRPRLITTEKDAARLGPALEAYWVIGVAHRFSPADESALVRYLESL